MLSDPRRANWLTLSSMTDGWLEETNHSRPSWELEAEILRLTTRLMMREREVRQVKIQLKTQTSRAQQQAAAWRKRMEEKEEQVRVLLLQKDAEMQNIVSQLLLFEAELRQEQRRIEGLMGEKDALIASQQREIERLKRDRLSREDSSNRTERQAARNEGQATKTEGQATRTEGQVTRTEGHVTRTEGQATRTEGQVRTRAIQDVTNVHSMEATERKKVPSRVPQKMKDLKAKRLNQHRGPHRPPHNEVAGGPAIL